MSHEKDLDFSEKLFNEGALSIVRAHMVNKEPFHLLIGTSNWRPMLDEELIEKRPIALMSFTGPILEMLEFDDEFNPVLFLAMKNIHTEEIIVHGLLLTSDNCQVQAIYTDKDGEPDTCIFYRPSYSHEEDFYTKRFEFSIDDIHDEEVTADDVQSSVNALFSHPDNKKFFE